jgi:hypothetical protein
MTWGLYTRKADCGLTCRKWWLHPMPNLREDSNKDLIFEIQLNLDFGKILENSTKRSRRNLDVRIFPKFF